MPVRLEGQVFSTKAPSTPATMSKQHCRINEYVMLCYNVERCLDIVASVDRT